MNSDELVIRHSKSGECRNEARLGFGNRVGLGTHQTNCDGPLVSVVMIFFNAARHIEEAIESVFAQTYDSWELLLVDDGSTDGGTEIARRYAERHPGKVHYLEHGGHENRGMSAARNLGIRQARGEFIALLDADDVWLPEKLERQVAILSSQPEAAMVYGATQWWYSWTGSPQDARRDFVHELGVPADSLVRPPGLLNLILHNEGASPCTCSVLLRREAVEHIGGFEEAFRGMYEDQAFFSKLCLTAPVYVSGECSSRYRQHPESCVSTVQGTASTSARLTFLTWLEGYLARHGIDDAEVWQALREVQSRRRVSVLKIGVGTLSPILRRFYHRFVIPASHSVIPSRNGESGEGRGLALALALMGGRGMHLRRLRDSTYGLVARLLRLPVVRQLRSVQFRRLQPFGDGQQRGTPIVRYYWARFLQEHRSDVREHGLEIGTTATIRQYGGEALTKADAIDLVAHSPEVTIVADLSRGDSVPSDTFDCFVNQFTMHVIYDVEAALYHSIRILKPGGVLLVNFPCLDYYFTRGLEMGTGAPMFLHWWFTPIQVENLLRRIGLTETDYRLSIYGNLFTRIAYQLNLPAEELTRHEREYVDPGHPLLICVRVVKPLDWVATKPENRIPWLPDTTPARWSSMTGHYVT